MEQSVLTREDFDEATVGHDGANGSFVHLTHLGNGDDSLDFLHGSVYTLLVWRAHLHLSYAVRLVNRNRCACVFLHLLDDFSARTDDRTNEFLRDIEGFDARYLRFQLLARLCYGLGELLQDVLTAGLGLHEGLFENLEGQSVALDVHLCGGETVFCARRLEVHVAQMVLISEDIGEDGVLVFARILDQSHRNARHRLLHWHAGIHQSQCSCAHCGHRRGAVRLQNLAHQPHRIGEVLRYLTLQCAPGQVTMAYLAASYAALCLSLAGAERREVVVKEEALVGLVEHIVDQFLVELRAKSASTEALCLSTGEYCGAVRHGKRRDLAPDGAYIGGLAAVQSHALVQDAAPHGVALHVCVVSFSLGVLLFQLLGVEIAVCRVVFLKENGNQLGESLFAFLLRQGLLHEVVGTLVKLVPDLLAQLFVVGLVVILALHVGAQLFHQLLLQRAHGLDGLVCGLQRGDKVLLRHLVHLAFHHHDVVLCGTHHEVHVRILHLFGRRVDDILAANACHAALRDGAFEGNVAASHGA